MSDLIHIGDVPEAPRTASLPALAPTVPIHGPVSPELDAILSALGCRAAAGETAALNTLYAAFAPRLQQWVRRAQRSLERYGVDRSIEPEDIAQQAFVVFADMILTWEDDRDLSRYVIAFFPWRLSDSVRRMTDLRASHALSPAALPLLVDDSSVAEEAVALLEAHAATLPAQEAQVLLLRIRDGCTWDEIARFSGIESRTAQRIWRWLLVNLRASLGIPKSVSR
jgi:DNA-directed RNA polymerase specialized sigma24 family protein